MDINVLEINRGQLHSFEEYDPHADTWRELPQMPTPRFFLASASPGRTIYALGGLGESRASLSVVEEYNISRRTWKRRADLPTARGFIAAVAMGNLIYTMGGRTRRGAPVEKRVVG